MEGKNLNFFHPKEWVKGNVVGSGSFGTVNLAMKKSTGELFVVKSAPSGSRSLSLEKEAGILENLDSPYVVRCLGHNSTNGFNGDQKFDLFMEYMAGGSLSDIIEKFGGALNESVIRSYTREILHGLRYIHKQGIVHCDLKCKNVLLSSSGNVKLADFGCARRLSSPKINSNSFASISGSPLWMAPEALRNEGLDTASDIWSLGCTVIEMATGRPPWGDEVSNPMATIFKIVHSDETPRFPVNFSDEGLDFLKKCFHKDPKSRWSSEELLNHPFVSRNSVERGQYKEDSCSQISVLDDWESDGSESPLREDLPMQMPFSTRKHWKENDDTLPEKWILVRSG